MLEDKKLAPGFGKPADPAALQRIAFAIRSGLNELGHRKRALISSGGSEERDGIRPIRNQRWPHLRVRQLNFVGDPQLSSKILRGQMRNIAPGKPLASLRQGRIHSGSL